MMSNESVDRWKKRRPGIFRSFRLQLADWKSLITLLLSGVTADLVANALDSGWLAAITMEIAVIMVWKYCDAKREGDVQPYREGRNFLGLCSSSSQMSEGLLTRNIEVKGIVDAIRKRAAIRPSADDMASCRDTSDAVTMRGAVCLTGKSGCGKSVLLTLVRQELKRELGDDYDEVDYTDRYLELEVLSMDDEINKWDDVSGTLTGERKNSNSFCNISDRTHCCLAIFDQFERYYALTQQGQANIRKLLQYISGQNNTVIVFAIREEFLLSFISEIDLNAPGSGRTLSTEAEKCCGEDAAFVRNIRMESGMSVSGETEDGLLIMIQNGLESEQNSVFHEMMNRCKKAFLNATSPSDDRGGRYYQETVSRYTLLQQQIVLNVLENEFETSGNVNELLSCSLSQHMARYYGRQLCSTKNYYDASRLMYLLSLARHQSMTMTMGRIYWALCIPDERGRKEIQQIAQSLCETGLLRNLGNEADKTYEVSHDYIADSFQDYALREMTPSVRTTIENYITRNRGLSAEGDSSDSYKYYTDCWEHEKGLIGSCTLSLMLIVGVTIWANVFGMEEIVPAPVPFLAGFSVFYVFCYYRNITRFCREKRWLFSLLYTGQLICGTFSVIAEVVWGAGWLICLSCGNALLGISAVCIGTFTHVTRQGRKLFIEYGCKTTAMGVIMGVLAWFLGGPGQVSPEAHLWAGVFGMTALLVYSYNAHMRGDYFYPHVAALLEADA